MYTKEYVQSIVDQCGNKKEVITKLGYSSSGGTTYRLFNKIFKEYEIDFTKFEENKNKRINRYKNYDYSHYFCENSRVARNHVKRKIIELNLIKYECKKCGLGNEWQGDNISLQLEHKNGINNDNRLENLEFLCPNCHSQTPNFAGKSHRKKGKITFEGINEKKESPLIKERLSIIKDVDLMKRGWVEKVSKLWGISHTSVKRWIRKHYPDLEYYER